MEREAFIEQACVLNKAQLLRLQTILDSVYSVPQLHEDANNRIVKTLHFVLILLMCSNNDQNRVATSECKMQKAITSLIGLKSRNRMTKHRILLTLDSFLDI